MRWVWLLAGAIFFVTNAHAQINPKPAGKPQPPPGRDPICAGLLATGLPATNIKAYVDQMSAGADSQKGEFEKSAPYRERRWKVAKAILAETEQKHGRPLVIGTREAKSVYDADEEKFLLPPSDLWVEDTQGGGAVVLAIFDGKQVSDSYEGTNAYGAKMIVRRTTFEGYAMPFGWPSARGLGWPNGLPLLPVNAPIGTARELKSHLTLVVVGTPIAPFVRKAESRSVATVQSPQDTQRNYLVADVDLLCASIVDGRDGRELFIFK